MFRLTWFGARPSTFSKKLIELSILARWSCRTMLMVPHAILGHELMSLRDSRPRADYGKFNTLYTYAFVIQNKYKKNGYAKTLKKVYLNWAKKREGIIFSTGHVKKGISSKFKGKIEIINQIENWQGTGEVFEYYRRDLDPEKIHQKKVG